MNGLPQRMFQRGHEPGTKRVNNYFKLQWVDYVKNALEDDYLRMLDGSQFGMLMKMGNHIFPVNFVHYLLCRQLVTEKKYELWWLFGGKPIRFGIEEFALVTGLNCGTVEANERKKKRKRKSKVTGRERVVRVEVEAGGSMWKSLFGDVKKPTPMWILDKLKCGKDYKDPVTRFRLALIFLVEGVLCPRSGTTNLKPHVVEMVEDIEEFLNYPWGRDSFLLTLKSLRLKTPASFVKDTTAIQGFPHGIVLVMACCCPEILASRRRGGYPLLAEDEDLVLEVVERYHTISTVSAKILDCGEKATVRSLLCEESGQGLGFLDEEEDEEVTYMLQLIAEDFPFEHNTWRGGVTAEEFEDSESGSIKEAGSPSKADEHGDGEDSPLHGFIRKLFEEYSLSLKAHIDMGLANLRCELMKEIKKTQNNVEEEVIEDIPIGTNVASSSRQQAVLIPAIKGSRKVHGLSLIKTRISWASDVYDPPPSSKEWLAGQVQEPTSSSGESAKKKKTKNVKRAKKKTK